MIKLERILCCISVVCFCFQLRAGADFSDKKSEEQEYKLVWQENFEGSTLNEANNWTVEVNGDGGGNQEMQYYRRENLSIGKEPLSGENCLILTAKKENFSQKKFTSGRLTTQGKMHFKYGKLEARIKMPETANGLWPAFWLLGANYAEVNWPRCGEIDILEAGNADGIKSNTQERYFNGACHWGVYANGGYPNYAKHSTAPYSLQDDFHLYTIIWDKDYVRMYLDLDKYPDAEPYFAMAINGYDDINSPGHYFDKPFFVILNLAVGGHFTGITGSANISKITALNESNNFQSAMYVDYVRLYQKGEQGEEFHYLGLNTGDVQTVHDLRFKIYPNPSTGYLNIDGSEIPKRVVVYDMKGKKVAEYENTNSIDISPMASGNYVLQIETNGGFVETHQLNKN
ncbi:T9SS C-terminal target domain-containing protein [Paludibacter sp. 221]|uniref:family 16 glycosylhydrolase n=1 Tax=Paludibacter sp. 221 TaxID=2302939 RepID=UPI0013D6DB8F|nr:family 16 glycosylhydrolase [Paludibacter sp. 221]NDV46812.1 T9SS C-terminal target domain-containing protein [Paludibacter sp. 221]